MRQSMVQMMVAGVFLGLGLALLAVGCDPAYGECSDDEDLVTEPNHFVNAICKDGQPACADGRPLCDFLVTDEELGRKALRTGCTEEGCVACPEGMLLCIMFGKNGMEKGDTIALCVLKPEDCWRGGVVDVYTL